MVPRKPKLIAAGAVLAVGLGVAWPLRRTEPLAPATIARPSATAPQTLSLDQQFSPQSPVAASSAAASIGPLGESALNPSGRLPHPSAEGPVSVTVEKPPSPPLERIHVVQNGDSLERLAQRYLGDAGRALELFDLNRKLLENPHILRLGAELRIPPAKSIAVD